MTKIQAIRTSDYGYYRWEVNGIPVGDEDGNFMIIVSKIGDRNKIKLLEDAAKYFGVYEDGKAVFCEGRPVTDEEYEEQRLRATMGLIPDPLEGNGL